MCEPIDSQIEELYYSALVAVEQIARRQQEEIDHLREIKRAARAILEHLEREPWRTAAGTFGPWANESDRLMRNLSRLLSETRVVVE
jgi:hypothetical protein